MQPPYHITPEIRQLLTSVSQRIGQINARYLDKPAPQLRKANKIRTIHSSLRIEGNTLSEDQITALVDKKRVAGPAKDVTEVLNAIEVYKGLEQFDPVSSQSFLKAHRVLMQGLVSDAGKYRTKGVGIVAGKKLTHMAPPAGNVPHLMKSLFHYIKSGKEVTLIKSCVFHYEMEFIHPFMDGNGRMGRLWQTLILMKEYPLFEFIPFENLIHKTQRQYYNALAKSDQSGHSTIFIEYMLGVINQSLEQMLISKNRIMSAEDRLAYFCEKAQSPFTRKDYLRVFPELSAPTASRDLKLGVDSGLFKKQGDKVKTVYKVVGKGR